VLLVIVSVKEVAELMPVGRAVVLVIVSVKEKVELMTVPVTVGKLQSLDDAETGKLEMTVPVGDPPDPPSMEVVAVGLPEKEKELDAATVVVGNPTLVEVLEEGNPPPKELVLAQPQLVSVTVTVTV